MFLYSGGQFPDFNPIIVLFLTNDELREIQLYVQFQSYYSLISNYTQYHTSTKLQHFNPIIVLFLTKEVKPTLNNSIRYFNPIIVLFLTSLILPNPFVHTDFNPIIVLFLTTTL